jgi:hypothetical protein
VKYRYLIFDTIDVCCKGANAIQTAHDFSVAEDFFVVDTETGETLTPSGAREPIENLDD